MSDDESVEINHNLNWPYIFNGPYKGLLTGGSRSSKAYELLKIIKHQQPDIDKIYLYIKDPFESMYQLLANRRENVGINYEKNPKTFSDYSQKIDDVYENIEDYNPKKK